MVKLADLKHIVITLKQELIFLKKILTYTVKISSLDIHETVNPCTQVSFAEKTEYNL